MRTLALALAVTLAACGGGSNDARGLVLRGDDLPDGWDATRHEEARDNYEQIGEQFDDCLGGDNPSLPDDAETASSPDFSQGGGARQVKSTVTRVDDADAFVAVLDRPRAARCMTEAFRTLAPGTAVEGLQLVDARTDDLAVAGGSGLRTTLDLRIGSTPITVHVDNVFLADGPWWARLIFVGTGRPLDRDLRERLVATVADRLASA